MLNRGVWERRELLAFSLAFCSTSLTAGAHALVKLVSTPSPCNSMIRPSHHTGGPGGRRRGRVKWFNVVKGYGFITPHDGSTEVFVHQTVIYMEGFRSLAEGEETEFESRPSDKGVEATFVCGPGGTPCRGSDRRPVPKRKFKKIRCYNCGDFAGHLAAKCPHPPLPKRCHCCKAEDHLIADCPFKDKKDSDTDNGQSYNGSGNGPGPGPGPGGTGFGDMGIAGSSTQLRS